MPKNIKFTQRDYSRIHYINATEVANHVRPKARGNAKLPKTTNQGSHRLVSEQMPFKGSNLYGFWLDNGSEYPEHSDDRYTVWSYGEHFPLFVYVKATDQWFYNEDRYSVSTSKQMSQSHPRVHYSKMTALDTDALRDLALVGFTLFSLDRIGGLA
jgi:hypothetical protein